MQPTEITRPEPRVLPHGGVVQFDSFELRLETGELRRDGMRVRLQTKPFQILAALLERPGRVVTREELRARLWPSDTFVDFESGLNTAANRLRIALGDSAENPRYIETLARIGYRFVAPVRRPAESGVVELLVSTNEPPAAVPANGAAEIVTSASEQPRLQPPSRRWPLPWYWRRLAAAAGAILALFGGGILAGRYLASRQEWSVRQISFRRGLVASARFTPSGEVVYSARWSGAPPRVFLNDTLSPESRDLGLADMRLASVSASSELALFEHEKPGLLARVPLHGGSPRVVAKSVAAADFSPLGGELCVAVGSLSGVTVEMPPGNVLYRTSGWIDVLRVSPDGRSIALLEHELAVDDAGSVVLIDGDRKVSRLSTGWASVVGLAWAPSGSEIFFSAARSGALLNVWAANRDGRVRHVASTPDSFVIFDIAHDGRVLASRFNRRLNMMIGETRAGSADDASWFDWTRAVAISDDGDRVLFDETGAGGGDNQAVFLRYVGDRAVERVGDGHALDLSADGRSALTQFTRRPSQITLITWPDVRRTISAPGLTYQSARFIPGGNTILVQANAPGKPQQLYVQDLSTAALRAVPGGEGLRWPIPSPDGQFAAGTMDYQHLIVVDLVHGTRQEMKLPRPGSLVRWISPERIVFFEPGSTPLALWTFDLKRQKASPLAEVPSPDAQFRGGVGEFLLSADLRRFAYSYVQASSELLLIQGWK